MRRKTKILCVGMTQRKIGAASQIRTGHRVPWAGAPWEPSDLAIEKMDEVASYAEKNKNPLRRNDTEENWSC